jgi:hypothetical protein
MGNYFFIGSAANLDEEFDASDLAADRDLCRALAAGRWGLHPDAWGNGQPVQLFGSSRLPALVPRWSEEEPYTAARQRATWRHKPQAPPREDTVLRFGWINLTCDDCSAEFEQQMRYPAGMRPAYVVAIRALGREKGWTCIVGRDRCPRCSDVSAHDAVA